MVGIPYLALGFVGFLVYRSLRARATWEQQQLGKRTVSPDDDQFPLSGDNSCSTPSPGDPS